MLKEADEQYTLETISLVLYALEYQVTGAYTYD